MIVWGAKLSEPWDLDPAGHKSCWCPCLRAISSACCRFVTALHGHKGLREMSDAVLLMPCLPLLREVQYLLVQLLCTNLLKISFHFLMVSNGAIA